MSAKSTHVLKTISGGWGVQKSDTSRASKVFDSQQLAIEHGRALARRDGTWLFIHRKDGTIKESLSWGLATDLARYPTSLRTLAVAKHSAGSHGQLRHKRMAAKKK